ncbi:MAG TPA: deoxynucleoside kinase [Acidimicrobiales bacterium]|nr:deoxynucleoside kinase [Acidimicrobiales bacterium]
MHWVVTGPIASGKTTCTWGLATRLHAVVVPENFEFHPRLADLHAGAAPACSAQRWFLEQFRQAGVVATELARLGERVVQDHSYFDVHQVFNTALHRRGWLSDDEFLQLALDYEFGLDDVRPPDLVIALNAQPASLIERVRRRGRPFEQRLTEEYLAELSETSRGWWRSWTGCRVVEVDTDSVDPRTSRGVDQVLALAHTKSLA